MNTKARKPNITLLSAAAFLFTQGNNTAKGLAGAVDIAEGTIYKWVKRPEWDKALDDLKFTGKRSLHREPRRDIQRDTGDIVSRAEQLYSDARKNGKTEKQAVTAACKALSIDRRRINKWRDRFGW